MTVFVWLADLGCDAAVPLAETAVDATVVVWLAGAPLTDAWRSAAGALVGGWDQAAVARIALVGVVLVDLVILNVRAGAIFVATLVNPREVVTGHEAPGNAEGREAGGDGAGVHAAAPPPGLADGGFRCSSDCL